MPQREAKRYDLVKRGLDVVFSGMGLVLTAPIQLTTAAVVLISQGRPALFRQQRPGHNSEVFDLVKFRTMLPSSPSRQTDAARLTDIGRFLRSTSIDELPTLWNVFVGDMSFVGPRPLLSEYLDRYTTEQARRHDVRPGITGLAQVSGRNLLTWDERLALDVDYVDNYSLALDAAILLRTVHVVLRRIGIGAEGRATMAPFTGSNQTMEATWANE